MLFFLLLYTLRSTTPPAEVKIVGTVYQMQLVLHTGGGSGAQAVNYLKGARLHCLFQSTQKTKYYILYYFAGSLM